MESRSTTEIPYKENNSLLVMVYFMSRSFLGICRYISHSQVALKWGEHNKPGGLGSLIDLFFCQTILFPVLFFIKLAAGERGDSY